MSIRVSFFIAAFAFGLAVNGGQKEAANFLQQYCVKCHGPKKQKGDLAFHELAMKPVAGPRAEVWKKMLHQLERGEMPP